MPITAISLGLRGPDRQCAGMMKTSVRTLPLLLIASAGVLAGCDDGVRITSKTSDTDKGGVLQVIDTLQCPDRLGSLTRKGSAQANGSICIYGGPRGAEVSLHLVALGDGSAETVLTRFEQQLTAVMPHTAAQMTAPQPPVDPAIDGERASVRAGAVNIDAHGDQASVNMPGIHIDADGDKAASSCA
ncbi:MAG: hypothetical protein EON96_09145 [Caulobacteraceae bacterium]|nr:MAG: hypothetical protein EON96_09145 [Caulobacteraceae bacterium]